ncbi:MAG TPA: ABC transporter ATP-binding protein [Candidatus Acetothermia bacterium]|nr:ABC transporter ATP-binding protein [Candidatus Acetothermia bacterium]
MISLRHVTVEYGTGSTMVRAVDDVSLDIPPGESLALIGPSGCGKTTLLFSIAGLTPITAGEILVHDVPVKGPRREMALILQNAGLLPWKTVAQNANLSLLLSKQYPGRTADAVLDDLGLGTVKRRYPSELSEGMKRRVGIARALSTSPSAMLMDEPLASLDTLTRERIQDQFLELWQQHGFTLLLVTHDMEEAAFLAQRIVVLSERPARIVQIVENPHMGRQDYRSDDAFRGVLSELRGALMS